MGKGMGWDGRGRSRGGGKVGKGGRDGKEGEGYGRGGEGRGKLRPFLKFLHPPLLVENTVLPRGYASASDSVCHPGQLPYHWIVRVSLAIRPLRKGCYMFLCNRVKFQGLTFSTGFM